MLTIWDKPILSARWAELIDRYALVGSESTPPVAESEIEAAIFAHAFKEDSDAMIEALGSNDDLVRVVLPTSTSMAQFKGRRYG